MTLVVGAALIHDGRLLAAQRTSPPELAGLWEFPGGKVEPGETGPAALIRECREELGADIEVGSLLGEVDVPVGTLRVYHARLRSGGVENREHQALRWLAGDELFEVAWIPVDRALVRLVADELNAPQSEVGPQ